MTLEDYLPIEKIANGVIYTTDHRYVKILEIEPINFLLRSTREQQSIIFSFISYLKISPVKLQIKMISKKADINKHLNQAQLELERETDPNCRQLQKDYIQFVRRLSSREAVSRRFFLIFEYEPFNVNRKVEETEILAALETAAQTAKTFLYQCGNEVVSHDNEDEFTTDVLYTLLNRTKSTEVPLPKRINQVLTRYEETGREAEMDAIHINEFIAPESVDFKHSNYVLINGVYHAYLLVPSDGYKPKVVPGWLSLLINAGEGIDVDFYLHKQPKDKIQQRLGQQIRINRSKIKDASDTNADFDDLDSAIRSGYFLKQGLSNNEDFYYMNLLITITANNLEELQWSCALNIRTRDSERIVPRNVESQHELTSFVFIIVHINRVDKRVDDTPLILNIFNITPLERFEPIHDSLLRQEGLFHFLPGNLPFEVSAFFFQLLKTFLRCWCDNALLYCGHEILDSLIGLLQSFL